VTAPPAAGATPLAESQETEARLSGPRLRVVPQPRLAFLVVLLGVLWLAPGANGRVMALGALVMPGPLFQASYR
jgi:hypothetical protein